MEEKKKDDNKALYICMGAAAVLGYAIGKKHGYNKHMKEMIRDWRQVNFGDYEIHLYYPKLFEGEVVTFFNAINEKLKEVK